MRTVEKTTRSGVEYTVQYAEDLKDAVDLLGAEGVLQAINYVLGVRAARNAVTEPPLPKELLKMLRKDRGLREKVMKELGRKSKITVSV